MTIMDLRAGKTFETSTSGGEKTSGDLGKYLNADYQGQYSAQENKRGARMEAMKEEKGELRT